MSTALAKVIPLQPRPREENPLLDNTSSQGSSDDTDGETKGPRIKTVTVEAVPLPLGIPGTEKRFWFQRNKGRGDRRMPLSEKSMFGL